MLKRIGLFVCLLFVMSSCSDDVLEIEKRELHDYVSASLVENDDVIAFGSMGVKKILDKTEYQNIQMLKGLIAPELATINGVLGMDTPIYFVVEGPISPRGEAKRVIFFMKVKNSDALKKELEEERGFLVESQGDIQYTEDNDFILGFRENLAIAVIQSDEFDASNLMEEMFAASQGPKSSGKEHELLETAGDVVLSVNLESLYKTSNTSLEQLNETKQSELEQMTKGSFTQTIMNFNKGNFSIESNNYFSEALDEAMFFKSVNSSEMESMLAKGKEGAKIVGGFSSNIDFDKMEHFYSSYAPEVIELLNDFSGGLYKLGGSRAVLSKFISGNLGVLALASKDSKDFADGARMFMGSTEVGKKAFMMMKNEIALPIDMEFDYVDGGIELLLPMDNHTLSEFKGDEKLKMPNGSEGFGTKGFFGFVNFDQMIHQGMPSEVLQIFDLLDYAQIQGGNEGMKFVLQMKNKNDNFLKQTTQLAMSMIPLLMGGMSF